MLIASLSTRLTSLAVLVGLASAASLAGADDLLLPLSDSPAYQLSNLRTERDRFGSEMIAIDFKRVREGKGRVVIRGKSAAGPLTIAASVPSSQGSGTMGLRSLFSNRGPVDIELFFAQPVRLGKGETRYVVISNSLRLGNPGPAIQPRAWTAAEKQAHADFQRIMSDDSAHKPGKSYPVSVAPPEDSVFVPATAKLTKGVRLQACWQDKWHPLTALSENDDATINVRWDTFGAEYDCSMSRGELIIAKATLDELGRHPESKYPATKPNIVDTKPAPKSASAPGPLPASAKPRKSYVVTIAVPADCQKLPAGLKLKPGIPLQACYGGKWNSVTTLGENEDGSVNVHWDGWSDSWECSMIRDELIIAKAVVSGLENDPSFTPQPGPLKRKSYPVSVALPPGSVRVPKDARLPAGTKLQACWAGKWNPITLLSDASDGTLNVRWDDFGASYDCSMLRAELIVDRRVLQQAQGAASKPAPDAAAAGADSPLRTWTDATGNFKIQARLLSRSATSVTLQTADGREITLPIDKLGEADRQRLGGGEPQNPFAP